MSIFSVTWTENKNADWKIISVRDEQGTEYTDVSVNRNDKKTNTVAFPQFDQITPGLQLEAQLWTNPSGKHYLFAPKPKAPTSPTGGQGGGMRGVAVAQARKADMIEKAQDAKSTSIMIASAFRDATAMVLELSKNEAAVSGTGFDAATMKAKHAEFVDWYILNWQKKERDVDLPF